MNSTQLLDYTQLLHIIRILSGILSVYLAVTVGTIIALMRS